LSQVRDAVTSLRGLDGPDFHTPVVMAVRGPKARALAVDLADTVTFAAMPGDSRAEIMRMAADFRAIGDVELALHVPVVGDAVSPFMTPPDTDPAALRAADSLLILPSDPTAAIEEVLRRREEGGFSYFVVGATAADALAPVVAELTLEQLEFRHGTSRTTTHYLSRGWGVLHFPECGPSARRSPETRTAKVREAPPCPTCFTTLPATGICGYCAD
jgi:hypothetical protein